MIESITDWKLRAGIVFAPLRSIDRSWFPASLQDVASLDVSRLTASTRRVLYRHLPKPDMSLLPAEFGVPDWAQCDDRVLRYRVLRLGAFALAEPLRHTIEQSDLRQLLQVIDDDTYRDAVSQAFPLTEDPLEDVYRVALASGDVEHLVAAAGFSVLQCLDSEGQAFIASRVRCLFSRKAWALMRRDLRCNKELAFEVLRCDDNVD